MKNIFFFLFIIVSTLGFSQPIMIDGQCGQVIYYNDNSTGEVIEIYFRINNQCKQDTFIIIDVAIFMVPDKFLVLDGVTKELIIDSGWIGCNSDFLLPEQLDSCTTGFAYITPQFKQYLGSNYPIDFYFRYVPASESGPITGWARIKVPTDRDLFIIKILPNQLAATVGNVYIHCVEPKDSLCVITTNDTLIKCINSPILYPPQTIYYLECCDSIINYTYIENYLNYDLIDTTICINEPVLLHNPVPDSLFIDAYWSDGYDFDHIVTPQTTQVHTLYVETEYCSYTFLQTINISGEELTQIERHINIFYGHKEVELNLCEFEQEWLFYYNGNEIYCNEIISINNEKEIIITFINKNTGCNLDILFHLNYLTQGQIYIPNIFSPNADGINDVFLIHDPNSYIKQINSFKIFDRWGNLIHTSINNYWNGTCNGIQLNSGTYIYLLEIINFNNEKQIFKGDVTIII